MALNPVTSTSAVLTPFACSVLAQTPIDFGDDSSTWANDDEVTGGRVERGRLEAGDYTLLIDSGRKSCSANWTLAHAG